MSHGRYSEDSSASELIGAVHASMHEEDSAAQEPLSTRYGKLAFPSCAKAVAIATVQDYAVGRPVRAKLMARISSANAFAFSHSVLCRSCTS